MRSIRGLSLIEALIAMVILSTAAIIYSSMWQSQVGANDSARKLEAATILYLRQVELLRSLDIKRQGVCGGVPYIQQTFQLRPLCAPPEAGAGSSGVTYGVAGTNQLEPAVAHDTLLISTNSYEFPRDDPRWIVCCPAVPADPCAGRPRSPDLYGEGFRVRVRARRIQRRDVAAPNDYTNNEHLLVKYAIRVNRVDETNAELNVLTGEIIQEVR